MSNSFVRYLLEGNNYPSNGQVVFDSSDHIRFQNGQDISGHNYGCNRRLVIKKKHTVKRPSNTTRIRTLETSKPKIILKKRQKPTKF
jgi:hypothetical protein